MLPALDKKPNMNLVFDPTIKIKRKLKNLGKAYEVSLDKIDEMQDNFFQGKIIPVGKKYREKFFLDNLLDVISYNQQN